MYGNTSSSRSGEIQSAGDIMRQKGAPKQPVDFITGKVLARKSFSGSSRYSYCPYCVQRVKRAGQDYKAVLKPMQSVTYKNLYRVDLNGGAKIIFEKEMECTVCREMNGKPKRITLDDFSRCYSEPYREDTSLYLNANDKEALRRAGFSEYAETIGY